ncbi:MAG: spheroidene monooxygenase [Hymenobacteraceae bacterium]|nr:spheroidene monooxygenase [Hymenobacteraceae bacterium]
MGTTPAHLRAVPGLAWGRMLGSGVDFGLKPNLHRYALLLDWQADEAAAHAFLAADPLLARWAARGWMARTTWLAPVLAHGRWDGASPFRPAPTTAPLTDDEPVAVLTRAAIRWRRVRAFWQAVPAASRAVLGAPGLRFSVGLGELPVVRQATVSLWDSAAQMKAYAYRAPEHLAVIKRTRAEGWYSEELFARFRVVRTMD